MTPEEAALKVKRDVQEEFEVNGLRQANTARIEIGVKSAVEEYIRGYTDALADLNDLSVSRTLTRDYYECGCGYGKVVKIRFTDG